MGKIKCLQCDTILESVHRHDFKRCECENRTHIDGGNDYLKFGGMNFKMIELWEEEKQEWYNASPCIQEDPEVTAKEENLYEEYLKHKPYLPQEVIAYIESLESEVYSSEKEILKNEFEGYEKYTEIIDLSDSDFPCIKKINHATGAFKDVYLKEQIK